MELIICLISTSIWKIVHATRGSQRLSLCTMAKCSSFYGPRRRIWWCKIWRSDFLYLLSFRPSSSSLLKLFSCVYYLKRESFPIECNLRKFKLHLRVADSCLPVPQAEGAWSANLTAAPDPEIRGTSAPEMSIGYDSISLAPARSLFHHSVVGVPSEYIKNETFFPAY